MALAPSGPGNSPEERAACLAEARRRGYPESEIQSFLADSPGDECRLLTGALAPTPGALAGDPWTIARSIPTDPVLRAAYYANLTPTSPLPPAPNTPYVQPLAAPPVVSTTALTLTAPIGGGASAVPPAALVPTTTAAPALAGLGDNKLLLLALAVGAYLVFVRRR